LEYRNIGILEKSELVLRTRFFNAKVKIRAFGLSFLFVMIIFSIKEMENIQ
jgi:hypothetical protein